MSVMSEYDLELQTISRIMEDQEPPITAELQIERRCDAIIRDLDDLCAMALNAETVDLVDAQRPAIGTMVSRVGTLASLLMGARNPAGILRLVRN